MMLSNKSCLSRLLPIPLATLLCCAAAHAEISDTIHPFVAVGYTYDDNLLRLSDGDVGYGQRSDRSTQTQAGILFDRPISQQRITGHAKVSRVTFDYFDQLDYNGKDFAADWAWRVTSRARGNIGATYNQTLTPFSDFHSNERNLRTQRSQYVNGAFLIFPSWQVRGAFTRNKFDYELPQQRANNRQEDMSEVGTDYLAASGSRFGIVARHLKGAYQYPRRINGVVIDDGYTQDELKANVFWLVSDITQVQLLAGYAKRKHDFFQYRDSSGADGRISVKWAPFKKVRFNADVWRNFAAVESTLVTNSLNRGASLGATWDVSAKVQANASIRREKRQFEETPGVVFPGDASDRVTGSTVGVTWAPKTSIQVSATAFNDRRNGNPLVGSRDYRASGASINISAQF